MISSCVFECIRIKVKPTASTNVPISYFKFEPSMGIMEAMS